MVDINNFFEIIADKNQEIIEKLFSGKDFWTERIVSYGQITPEGKWYDQETNEWVILLKGSAKIRFFDENELTVLNPGDYVLIPAHSKHRVEYTEPEAETIWLAIHYYD